MFDDELSRGLQGGFHDFRRLIVPGFAGQMRVSVRHNFR